MERIRVQSVDLFLHPFYKLSREAGLRALRPQEKRFLGFLEARWKKAIVSAKRKKGNLFLLIDYPLTNEEARESLERIKAFAENTLNKRFRLVSVSLSLRHRVKRPKGVSFSGWPFTGVSFSKGNQIKITSWGESLGTCPVNEAIALQSALKEAGFKAVVVQKNSRSVKEHVSIRANMRRMKGPARPKRRK